eukprot:PITA_22298
MQDWDLIDIKPTVGKCTWSNKRVGPGHIAARLDRFLVQSSFLLLGLEAKLHSLHSSISDHKPISLELLITKDLGPIPFKFSSLWIKEKYFMEKIRKCWKKPVNGSAFFMWEEKLRRVKIMLKAWAKTLPNPAAERKKIQREMERQHLHLETVEITKVELEKEAKLQQSFHKACLAEENSGGSSLGASGSNLEIEIPHSSINKPKPGKATTPSLYREEVGDDGNVALLDVVPIRISSKMNQYLEDKVTLKEVKEDLFSMDPDKAPGPDGFTPRFLQVCWQIVEKDLYKMIQKYQYCQKIGGSTNSAFLALIPKEKGANSFSRFRPISLCNIGYKVITKVIANRLKRILPKIIPDNQGGLIQGRQLVDNFVLVQEVIHSSLNRKEKGMAVKLDLANAFDRVRHSFMFDFLQKMGFGPSFIKWIRACISEPWIDPLVNGRAADFFKASRGLRQGCPLSPLLFVLQASVLSFYLQRKQQDQELTGLCIARGVKSINHALFADDTILLGATSPHSASKFKEFMEEYCKISGSVLNNAKCHIYSGNIPASTANSIARCLGFAISVSWSSFKYPGFPIFHSRALGKDWLSLLDKFKLKL